MLVPISQRTISCTSNIPRMNGVKITEEFIKVENILLDAPKGGQLHLTKRSEDKVIYLRETKLLDMDDLVWLERFGIETVEELFSIDRKNPQSREIISTSRFDFDTLIEQLKGYMEYTKELQSIMIDSYVCIGTFTDHNAISISILFPPLLITISGEIKAESKIAQIVLSIMSKIKPAHLFATHNKQNFIDAMVKNLLLSFRPEWKQYEILKRDFKKAGGYLPLSMTCVEDLSKNAVLMLFDMLNKE